MSQNQGDLAAENNTKLIRKIKKDIEVSLPCVVVKVHSRILVDVRPLIQRVDSDGNRVSRQVITHVPVETLGGGSTLITFPVAVGDLGWIDASDRDISLFLQSYKESQPGTARMHSLSDARFVPDIMTEFTVSGEDSTAVVIQSRNGSVKIALDQDEIRIKNQGVSIVQSSSMIDVENGAVSVSITDSQVTGTAPAGFDLNGTKLMLGGIIQTNSINAANSLVVKNVEMDGHKHAVNNVQAGNDAVTSEGPSA